MDFTTAAWIWLYIGAFLMFAEIVSPGFVVFFFGLSAVTVAGLKWLLPGMGTAWQLAAFSVLCVVYLVTLRRMLKNLFMGSTDADRAIANEYVGRVGKVVKTIRPEVPGRILLGDAEWAASAEVRIEEGAEVRVAAQNNLTLAVKPLD